MPLGEGSCHLVQPELCPIPTECNADPCCRQVHCCQDCVMVQGLGTVVYVDVRFRMICPGRPLAAAVFLAEQLPDGREVKRGMKVLTVPPLPGNHCRDVILRCVPFVVPEPPCSCCTKNPCQCRTFLVRTLANYLDGGPGCCE